MSAAPRIATLESPSGRVRRSAAADFLTSFPAGMEILVVGPTRDTVDDLVRSIASDGGALFGVHRYGFRQLVTTVAASELASEQLTPATALGLEAVATRATFDAMERGTVGRWSEVAARPGFARALASTIDELRLSGVDARQLAEPGERTEDLRALTESFESEATAARIADRARVLQLATWAWRRPHWGPLRNAPILLLDVPIRTRREREFIEALLRSTPSALATIPAGDRETREALVAAGAEDPARAASRRAPSPPNGASNGSTPEGLARLGRWLFSDDDPPEGAADDESVRFLSAPGEGRECTEIVRLILDEAESGVRFDEMAVFLRSPETYSAHLETALRRAGVPALFTRGTKRPDPSGRAFLALLSCRSERLSAKRFAEYLSFAQVPDLDGDGAPPAERDDDWTGPVDEELGPAVDSVQLALFAGAADGSGDGETPAAADPTADDGHDDHDPPALDGSLRAPWKWEELLVEAAVIGGADRWQRRLDGLAAELTKKRAEAAARDAESPRVAALDRERTNLEHLERFALPVIHALDALPERAVWGEWLDRLSRLAPRVLRRPERVQEVLAEMRPMAAVGPLGIDEVRCVLADRLANLEEERPPHRYGRVFVSTPEGARGRSFRVVFVTGLAERVFPRRPREDPLLLDVLREELSDELPLQEDRGHDERMLLRVAVGAAEERVVLSYPRVDVAHGRPRVPSFYALDVIRATRGALPDWEALEREAEAEADARLAWPAPKDPERAVDPAEHDLATLLPLFDLPEEEARGRARYLLGLNDHLARALRSQWMRWWKRWWPADGIVRVTDATRPLLERERLRARPYSVTALERFAHCPYRFLLSAIHRLQPREEAVALVQLDPLTRGSMIHEIQATTLRALRDDDRLPIASAELDDVLAILDDTVARVASAYEDELAPAIRRVWQDELDAIRADLRVWLRRLADSPWTPAHFELSFGLPVGSSSDPAAVEEVAVLPGDWQLRGAIDLVERGENGLRVTDHKTGRVHVQEGEIVGGGRALQPVLYGLAAERLLGDTVAEARLSYCTARGGFEERRVEMNAFARLQGQRVLEIVDSAVEHGWLHPAPREKGCRWCDFRAVCGPSEERRVRTKNRDPLEALRELRELP